VMSCDRAVALYMGSDYIFKCKKPCNGAWVQVDGRLKQIDGGEQYVYGVNSNNDIFSRPVDGRGSWRGIPGKLKHVTASSPSNIHGVNTLNENFLCKKPCIGGFELLSGRLVQVDGTHDALVGVNASGDVFIRFTGEN